MKLHCPQGHVIEGLPFNTRGAICPEHNVPLKTGMQMRQGKGLKRSSGFRRQNESPAEREARQEFHRVVCRDGCWARRYRPCSICLGKGETPSIVDGRVFCCSTCDGTGQHVCSGPVFGHHLLPYEWLKRVFSDLPESEFLAIAYNPLIGAPACTFNFHAALESRSALIYYDELEPELIDWLKELEGKYPGRPSLLGRLELESPKRDEVAA